MYADQKIMPNQICRNSRKIQNTGRRRFSLECKCFVGVCILLSFASHAISQSKNSIANHQEFTNRITGLAENHQKGADKFSIEKLKIDQLLNELNAICKNCYTVAKIPGPALFVPQKECSSAKYQSPQSYKEEFAKQYFEEIIHKAKLYEKSLIK